MNKEAPRMVHLKPLLPPPPTLSLERKKMEAEEISTAAAKHARSTAELNGIFLNFSNTPTCSIIITACPIFDFAADIDSISTHVGIF